MTETITCSRCGEQRQPLDHPPFPGDLGKEIYGNVCADCWAEWRRAEVMVINELRLNFMDPTAQEILSSQLREFLNLPVAKKSKSEHP